MFSARAISLSFTGVLPTTPEEAVREQVYTSVDAVPAEVWFAAAIFESVVYPYHARGDGGGGDGGGGGGGSARVEEMER